MLGLVVFGVGLLILWVVKSLNATIRDGIRMVQMTNNMPGPAYLPVIGCILSFPKTLEEVPDALYNWSLDAVEKGSHFMRLWIFSLVTVMGLDHESVKPVLTSPTELTKSNDYKLFERWLGPGLLLGDGERWHRTRKLVTPAFHFSKLDEYAENTIMGVELNSQQDRNLPYVKAVEKYNNLMTIRTVRPLLRPQFFWSLFGYEKETVAALEVLHGFTNNVVKERMEIFAEERSGAEKKKRLNFLDIMLEQQHENQLSMQHLREEVDTFMFAGHDTTSHAVSWAVWALATHPEYQQKVYEELIENFGHSDADLDSSKIKDLKYLDQFFKETLRMFPPVPAIQRRLENDIEICGEIIPKGVSFTIPMILLHRNPKLYADPLRFDPERFAEGAPPIPPMAYVPFSAGPRNCIGQKFATLSAKLMLAHLVMNFRLESDQPFEANRIQFEVVLRPSLGVPVRLISRHR